MGRFGKTAQNDTIAQTLQRACECAGKNQLLSRAGAIFLFARASALSVLNPAGNLLTSTIKDHYWIHKAEIRPQLAAVRQRHLLRRYYRPEAEIHHRSPQSRLLVECHTATMVWSSPRPIGLTAGDAFHRRGGHWSSVLGGHRSIERLSPRSSVDRASLPAVIGR